MRSVLVVGGDHIDGIKQALSQSGIDKISHWAGRKSGDTHRVIPQNTHYIVLITKFISHSFMHSIKQYAAKRGLTVLYTSTNSASQLSMQLAKLANTAEDYCRKTHTISGC
jgi:hypothetical protein